MGLKKYLGLLLILFIAGCQPQSLSNGKHSELKDSMSSNEHLNKEITSKANVYVTAIEADSNLGNAAAYQGILNIKNNCLFIDDMLVVIQTPYLKWRQDPFIIYNELNKEEMRIGDMVEAGGSSFEYSSLNFNDTKWQNLNNINCKFQKIWLTSNMDLLMP